MKFYCISNNLVLIWYQGNGKYLLTSNILTLTFLVFPTWEKKETNIYWVPSRCQAFYHFTNVCWALTICQGPSICWRWQQWITKTNFCSHIVYILVVEDLIKCVWEEKVLWRNLNRKGNWRRDCIFALLKTA